jgi:hypothetical protein
MPYPLLINTTHTLNRARQLLSQYDGDNDTMPGLPRVTHTEFELLEMVQLLSIQLQSVQDQIIQINKEL